MVMNPHTFLCIRLSGGPECRRRHPVDGMAATKTKQTMKATDKRKDE